MEWLHLNLIQRKYGYWNSPNSSIKNNNQELRNMLYIMPVILHQKLYSAPVTLFSWWMYSKKVVESSQLHILLKKSDLWHRSTGSTKSSRICALFIFCTWCTPAYITIILANRCIRDTWDISSQLGSNGRWKAHWTWWILPPDWVMMIFPGSQWMVQLMPIQFITILYTKSPIYPYKQRFMTYHDSWIPSEDKVAWKWSIPPKSQ